MHKISKEFVFEKLKNINLTYLITGLIILCGIILRLKVYFYNESFWIDECSLGTNILEKSYLQLFKPLDYCQVASPFFLVVSKLLLDLSHQINNIDTRDLILRLFPCICSIASLPLFAVLVNKMFNNRYFSWISVAILAFNPTAINYAQEFKQYSCEMMFSIILLLTFVSLDIKTVSYKKLALYSLIFTIAPWFSSSAWFVMAAGFLVIIIDMIKDKYFDKAKIAILFIPLIANFLVWDLLYYKPVNKALYNYMLNYWTNKLPAFLTFDNFSKMFVDKMQNLISFPYPKYLFVFLFLNLIIFFTTKEYRNKCYTLIPILLCITASFLEHYPFEQRLILFLLPMFIIIYCQPIFIFKNTKITTISLIIILIFTSLNITTHSSKKYVMYKSSARELFKILKNENPSLTNVIRSNTRHYDYYSFKQTDNTAFCDEEINKIEKSSIPEKIQNAKTGDYWLYIVRENRKTHTTYSGPIKTMLYNDTHLKVIKAWTAPYDENIYLIHFKKIKDYN